MRILIKAVGFIGDNLFASSIPKKIRQEHITDEPLEIDLQLSRPEPFLLLERDSTIDYVYLPGEEVIESEYDKIYQLQPIDRKSTPCEQFQKQCGVDNPTPEYKLRDNSVLTHYIGTLMNVERGKTLVAYLENWEERTFLYTKEEYSRGEDKPPFGYGGKRRDTKHILAKLGEDPRIALVPVGIPPGVSVGLPAVHYDVTASILRNCKYFIGAEGGLANLAAGLGVNTILTGDFVHQLYGPNGVLEKVEEPKLGPKYYIGVRGTHIVLDPYLTDEEVIIELLKYIHE